MLATSLRVPVFRFCVKDVTRCLHSHKRILKAIHGSLLGIRTVSRCTASSCTIPVGSGREFGMLEKYTQLRFRVLCSDANATVKEPRGRKVTVPNVETKQYLTSIGLDCDIIQEGQPMVLLEDVTKVRNHVTFLQNLNLSDEEVVAILKKTPELLKVNTASIQEHIRYLQDLELEGLLILNIMQRVPRFFTSPLSRIESNVEYIQSLSLTNKNMRILLKYFPSLFYRRKNGVQYAGECLQRILLEHDPNCNPQASLKYMIRTDPLLFGRTVGEIEHRVTHLISLGFDGISLAKIIRFCPSVLRIGTEFITERLLLVQKCLSLTREQSLDIVMRLPKILHASDHTLETKVDYLFKRGYTAADIFRNPRVFNTGLERMASRLDKLAELKFRPKSLSFMQRTDEWFENYLQEIKHRQEEMVEKSKQSSE
ncbi:uncharacterized protein LOC119744253 [Patiria miniata]|uniref:Mitochondrial transcription termination factor n=1 Tax=Patiria miniata TaxID=46514 RepID=A0A914BKP1_PATMI|nr:uncharacterized protein LOC119744253 [Patiria miniata]XP_038076032.1 uncharacterized protein LOC119744253 [Patiria miniata]